MEKVYWDPVKSARLKKVRGASFEEILGSRYVASRKHPVRTDQDILLFDYRGYIWVVPCVVSEQGTFLKTLYPSRKYTKIYRKEGL